MRGWPIVLLLAVAAAAQASPLRVERAPVDLLHAERLELSARFEPVRIETSVAPVGSTKLDGAELSELMTPAGTFISRGHWTYAITFRERAPDAVAGGVFVISLQAPGVPTRHVTLVQQVANPLLAEGARVSFDLGPTLPPAPHFVVTLRELPQGTVHHLTSAINETFEYVWRDGLQNENPLLDGRAGEPVTFVITNGDGTSKHNFQVDGETSEDVVDLGDETTLVWTPSAPGSYGYQCQYHPTMVGTIEVE